MSSIKAVLKFIAFVLLCLIIVPTQMLVLFFHSGKGAYILPTLWCTLACKIFGIRFELVGTPNTAHQTLYMGNHLSYLDIPLIGSVLKASFLAKSEVASWPLFGFLAKLQQTSFIERKRTAIAQAKNELDIRLAAGHSLIIFPEGTSTDGQGVYPFKPSLFQLALGENNENLYIQPFTLKLLTANGQKPETQEVRDIYSWHINMDTALGPHLWGFAKTSGAVLRLTFHEPLKASDFTDRKILAKTCHEHVLKGLNK